MQNPQLTKSLTVIGFSLVSEETATIKSEMFPFVTFSHYCYTYKWFSLSLWLWMMQFSEEKLVWSPYNNLSKNYAILLTCRIHHTKCLAGRVTSWNQDCRRSINNFKHADDTILMVESKEEQKNLLMRVKEESEKPGLKLNIQKTKIITSGPITSWQIHGESGNSTKFCFLGFPNHCWLWLQPQH